MAEIVIKKTVQINVKEFLDACHLVELIQIQQEINLQSHLTGIEIWLQGLA